MLLKRRNRGGVRGRARGTRLYVRHHCSHCQARVFPFDMYEDGVIAPVRGRKKKEILLATHNQRDVENRQAWCFSCGRFVRCVRMTEVEFLRLYNERRGVKVRK
jgi:hypothetical protein